MYANPSLMRRCHSPVRGLDFASHHRFSKNKPMSFCGNNKTSHLSEYCIFLVAWIILFIVPRSYFWALTLPHPPTHPQVIKSRWLKNIFVAHLFQYSLKADEPMARMPWVACRKISLALAINCCPKFYISLANLSLYCEEYICVCVCVCIYIYIYTHTHTHTSDRV